MAIANTKIVQAYIQALVSVINQVVSANTLGQTAKAKYVAKNPDLTGTNITEAQITAVNAFLVDLNTLATGGVATTILAKDQPSHGTTALDAE